MKRAESMSRQSRWCLFALAVCGAVGFGRAEALWAAAETESATPRSVRGPTETIDTHLASAWEQSGITPSEPATDGEWCRRLYLDILGRIPTVAELQEFLASKGVNKREKLVDRLLEDDRYVEEYARNWSTIWTNLLIGRTGGTEDNTLISREGMQKYLRDTLARNRPYQEMVYELIAATGTTTPGSPDFNGATNFLSMKLEDNAVQATAKTAQLFLGTQVQCTQCHNHPFNEWKQNQFWEMNAFFRQTVALRRFQPGTNDIQTVELTDQDFGGDGNTPEDAELYYELRNGLLKAAYPVFVDGVALENRSGFVSDVRRREELAKMVVQSPYLQAAMVNRMWGHFLGYGFTKPVDDMGPHNSPSHPELLDELAREFAGQGYDMKKLMRWIVLSRPYSLSSCVNDTNRSDDPLLGDRPQFSHFYLRQMRAEELYQSLLVATEAQKSLQSTAEQEEERAKWLSQFNIAFGTDEGDETTTFNGTIPQALMMFNGALIQEAVRIDTGNLLSQVIAAKRPEARKIEVLFLAGLARKPTREELQAANQLLITRAGDRQVSTRDGIPARSGNADPSPQASPQATVLQDIWWAILNSNEFIFNH